MTNMLEMQGAKPTGRLRFVQRPPVVPVGPPGHGMPVDLTPRRILQQEWVWDWDDKCEYPSWEDVPLVEET